MDHHGQEARGRVAFVAAYPLPARRRANRKALPRRGLALRCPPPQTRSGGALREQPLATCAHRTPVVRAANAVQLAADRARDAVLAIGTLLVVAAGAAAVPGRALAQPGAAATAAAAPAVTAPAARGLTATTASPTPVRRLLCLRTGRGLAMAALPPKTLATVTPAPPATAGTQPPAITRALVPAGGALAWRPVHHPAFSLRQRANYALSEYVMWHPAARLVGLFAAAAIVIYLAAFAYRLCDPSGKEADAPVWLALRGYLSPMDNDFQDNKLRVLSVCLALAGTVLFGILVGVVTESVESTIAQADSGLSNVVVSGHTLICGWNGNTASVVRDLHALGGKRRIVLLVSADEKDRVMDELRDILLTEQQKKRLKISVRSGTPLFPGDLARVAASHARKIILVSDQNVSAADSDRRILARALALKTFIPSFSGEVVAELSSSREKASLTSILKSTNTQSVQAIGSERLLYRFMAQAVRQKGLADIVSKLMGTDAKTIFRVLPVSALARNLVGMNFAAIRPTVVPGCIICGFVDESTGNAVLSTSSSKISLPTLTPSTRLLVLGEPSGSVSSSVSRATVLNPVSSPTDSILSRRPRIKSTAENILICGWRPDIREMLTELDGMLHSGSRITILDENAPDPTVEYKFKNIAVSSIRKRPDRFANLKELLQPSEKPFDRILVLSMALKGDIDTGLSIGDVEQDSLVLSTICWLSELLGEPSIQRPTTLTVEFAHDQVGDVVRKDSTVTNSIQPYSLSARISAQTVRDSRLNEVWSELLQQRGREVYIRPISSYIDPVKQMLSFATISDQSALQRDELVVGYIPKDGEAVINPDGPLRYNSRKWSQDDRLVVIALD